MAKELMEIGGFITEGAEIVNHDASLSGNGTVDSPLGLNETVLWEIAGGYTPGTGAALTDYTITLNESISNFERIRIEMTGRVGTVIEMTTSTTRTTRYITAPDSTDNNNIIGLFIVKDTNDQTHINFKCGYGTSYITAYRTGKDYGYVTILKVVGINRIANN